MRTPRTRTLLCWCQAKQQGKRSRYNSFIKLGNPATQVKVPSPKLVSITVNMISYPTLPTLAAAFVMCSSTSPVDAFGVVSRLTTKDTLTRLSLDDASVSDHGDHGDAFHVLDGFDEMYSAVAGIKERVEEDLASNFEYEMLSSKKDLDKLMHSRTFRRSLDSEDIADISTTTFHLESADALVNDELRDHDLTHYEYAALKKKKLQDQLMSSNPTIARKVQGSHDDDHSVHHFELSLLESHAALDKVLEGSSFKTSVSNTADDELIESLHDDALEKREKIDDHMSNRGYPLAADAVDPTTSHYEYYSLKKKKALDDLMSSKGFRHNLDISEDEEDVDEPHPMEGLAKAADALGKVMGGEAFRKSLEGDANLGIAGVDSEYNIAMPPKTHNDIVSHFEFAGLKKRAALDKLASSDCDGLRM